MTEPQRKLAHELLKTGLSDRGYLTYTQIMQLEDILKVVGAAGANGSRQGGLPVLGLRHAGGQGRLGLAGRGASHLAALHARQRHRGGSTPTFAGTNPAEVHDGPEKGKRVLAMLEDAGRALVMALDASQRATATINATAPNEIVTTNKLDINPLSPEGLKVSAMNAAQRER